MAELDFTAFNRLRQKGIAPDERAGKSDMTRTKQSGIIQGFTEALNKTVEPSETAQTTQPIGNATEASERKKTAFKSKDERDYNALYRVAHEYHKRHTPPMVERDYWMTHTAGEDLPPQAERDYWIQAAKDMNATASAHGNDPFLTGLLIQIYEELEREYKRLVSEIHG